MNHHTTRLCADVFQFRLAFEAINLYAYIRNIDLEFA